MCFVENYTQGRIYMGQALHNLGGACIFFALGYKVNVT
jgi:hypothetical protein